MLMENKEWRGDEVDTQCVIGIIDHLRLHYDFENESVLRSAYTSIIELLSNVSHHAYLDGNNKPKKHAWEIAVSSLDKESVSIVVADYGVTIPFSIIERLNIKQHVAGIHLPKIDDDLIKEAIYSLHIETKLGRGLGLRSIIDAIEEGSIENISIRSRDGFFQYKASEGGLEKEEKQCELGTKVEIIIRGAKK